jgi:hypothetical protein
MPRIGTGHAGGSWPLVEELIVAKLISKGVPVTVYSLPQRNASRFAHAGDQNVGSLAL